jgi:hypothetical protein
MKCADSSMVELPLFPEDDGGSSPTSALHLFFRQIDPQLAAVAYNRWHYLGDVSFLSTVNFGAYYQNVLEGAISYGAPNATELDGCFDRFTQEGWWEIKRLAMSEKCPKNSESRFIGKTIRMLRKITTVKGIITYADDGVGHTGTIYRASGFKACGLTAAKKDFYVNGKIQQRGKTKGVNGEWRDRSRKWLFVKRFDGGVYPNE